MKIDEPVIAFHAVVLEDEELLAEQIQEDLMAALSCIPPVTEPLAGVRVAPEVHAVDNMEDARRLLDSRRCDLLLADMKVKYQPSSPKGTASARAFIQEIMHRQLWIPIKAHSVWKDQLEALEVQNALVATISKQAIDSVTLVVKEAAASAATVCGFRQAIWAVFHSLRNAVAAPSPIALQADLDDARRLLAGVQVPDRAPTSYRKTLVVLKGFLFRISSIPSSTFSLGQLSSDLLLRLQPLFLELCGPFLSYRHHTVPVLIDLEAAGYDVIMRVKDE